MSDQELREDVAAAVAETRLAIRRLHQEPDINVVVSCYAELHPFGRYVPGDSAMGEIEISLFGPHPRLTFAHEVGHLLDQAIVGYTGYASAKRYSALHDVMDAIRNSNAYRYLLLHASTNGSIFAERLA